MFNTKYWHLMALLRNERRSLDELLSRQFSKLQALLAHAYRHVPLYRQKYRQVGYQPGDIKSIDDLQLLPIIGKADFHAQSPKMFIDRRLNHHGDLIPIRTSGSSGQTLEFYIDRSYDQFRKAQFLRPYLTNGQKLTDRILTFKGQPQRDRRLFEWVGLLREQQIASHRDPALHLEILRRTQPSVLRGYPSVLALLGAKILASGPLDRYPRMIFTDSELLTPTLRRSIETAFKRSVIDIYGTLETDNIAYECERHCGYHIAIDAVILEFVADNRPVPSGVSGEIVCTVLNNYAMPFIRYRLNDFGIGGSE
jgi:phenylacetate-CoA ligase